MTFAEQSAIDNFGLYNLLDFLPKKPNSTELEIIKEMFAASVDGEAYDPERWGQYYKPAGLNQQTGDPSVTEDSEASYVTPAVTQPVYQPVSQPAVQAAPQPAASTIASDSKAQDILAMIRNRNNG